MVQDPFHLAIVTGRFAPQLSDGGQQVATALSERGIDSDPVMWNDPTVDWRRFDGVLVRSCWEYPEDRGRFQTMLDEIEDAGVPICNPLSVLRWNLHKSYLPALDREGVQIPATTVIKQGTDTSLEEVIRTSGWDDVVVKPAIGAMSSDVWRTSATEVAESEQRFTDHVTDHDVLVQEFVPEISAGERSIVFFGGEYSHAWNSLPAEDDVTEFDGIDAEYDPPSEIRRQAGAVLQSACEIIGLEKDRLPYARIDYVHRDDDLLLMELELIEPYLGFERGDDTIERFCEEVVSYFEERTSRESSGG